MRFLAGVYLAIALINFWLWLNNGQEVEVFANPGAYVTWALFAFTLLSLFAYMVNKRFLPQRIWQIVFAVYCTVRMYELATKGLTLSGVDTASDLNIITSYLWLLLPPGMAMWYLGFAFKPATAPVIHEVHHLDHGPTHGRPKDTEHGSLHTHYTEQLP